MMLVDQFGERIPNHQQTAICCKCGQRNMIKNMKERTYILYPTIMGVLVRFCNTKFCISENNKGEPGRVQALRDDYKRYSK